MKVRLTVKLDPSASGPEFGLQWFVNGFAVIPDAKYALEGSSPGGDPFSHSLVIRSVDADDNGEYSCTVVNRDSSETRSCRLVVQGESLL